jgi:uncharacterized protein (DUF2461 family)
MNVSETILALSTARGKDKTICPSEVARAIWPAEWRNHMDETRKAAFALRDEGKVVITQKGNEIIGDEVIGPIRIRIV